MSGLVRQRHENDAAHARLQVLLGKPVQTADVGERLLIGLDDRRDRDQLPVHTEPTRQLLGIAHRVIA